MTVNMPNTRMTDWQRIPINLTELCLGTTLRCGQSFRWKKSGKDEWSCALQGRILSLRQDPKYLHYRAIYPAASESVSRSGKGVKTERKGRSRQQPLARTEKRKRHIQPETVLPPTPPCSSPLSDAESQDRKSAVFIKKEDDDVVEDGGKDHEGRLGYNSTHLNIKDDKNYYEDDDDTPDLVKHYLNLDPNLEELYEQWAAADENFRRRAPRFTGVRILRQNSWEALVGFICSSNNNIARISQMVDKLCTHYGTLVGYLDHEIDDEKGIIKVNGNRKRVSDYAGRGDCKPRSMSAIPYYDFPTPDVLARPGVEQRLRELGLGYRAKYLYQTAIMVTEKGLEWLDGLRNPESPTFGKRSENSGGEMMEDDGGREGYRRAHESLLALQGVGPKVADCVCLMGLGWGEAVPVDTHVWQIAQRDYRFGKGRHSSLTKATYDAIGARFRSLWGKEAGWAHSVLFAADLRTFADRLVIAKVEKMSASSGDEIDTKVKVKVKAEVKTEDTESDELGDRLAGVRNAVKRKSEEENDEDNDRKIDDIKVKEESSARSIRAKRRRMM